MSDSALVRRILLSQTHDMKDPILSLTESHQVGFAGKQWEAA